MQHPQRLEEAEDLQAPARLDALSRGTPYARYTVEEEIENPAIGSQSKMSQAPSHREAMTALNPPLQEDLEVGMLENGVRLHSGDPEVSPPPAISIILGVCTIIFCALPCGITALVLGIVAHNRAAFLRSHHSLPASSGHSSKPSASRTSNASLLSKIGIGVGIVGIVCIVVGMTTALIVTIAKSSGGRTDPRAASTNLQCDAASNYGIANIVACGYVTLKKDIAVDQFTFSAGPHCCCLMLTPDAVMIDGQVYLQPSVNRHVCEYLKA